MGDKNLAIKLESLFFPEDFRDCFFVREFGNYVHQEYDYYTLKQHTWGNMTVACASVNGQGLARWLAIDLDNPKRDKGVLQVNSKKANEYYAKWSGRKLLEVSNYYGGYHVWFFLDSPVPAQEAMMIVRGLCPDLETEVRPCCEIKVGDVPYHLSQTLRLPYGFHPQFKQKSLILKEDL